MKLETILDAMLLTADADKFLSRSPSRYLRAQRQYNAFRDQILRMGIEKDYAEACIMEDWHTIKQLAKRIAELEMSEEKYRLHAMDLEEKLELSNRLRVQRFHYIAELELSLKLRDKRITELEAMIDEVVALDPLFPDDLMDRLKGVE